MDTRRTYLRRSQLDDQLHSLKSSLPSPPNGGWLKAVREGLGMSLEQFGRRLGLTRQGAHRLEGAEASGSISVNKLRGAADALGCDLVVLLVPRKPLQQVVRERAREIAAGQVESVGSTMALEDQAIDERRREAMVADLTDEILRRGRSDLWK